MHTIILAAGQLDHRNTAQGFTSSQLLSTVSGRPAIAWVVGDLLKHSSDHITLVVNSQDSEMLAFCRLRYGRHDRINICVIENSQSILHSILAGLESVTLESYNSLRINLGDTLLQNVDYQKEDAIYLADFSYSSQNWCVVALNRKGMIKAYYNKQRDLHSPAYKAVVGRYEFTDWALFEESLQNALRKGKNEISDVLELYSQKKPLQARLLSASDWIDFGHLEGFAKARLQLVESRYFNTLKLHPILPEITKSSLKNSKIAQEIFWYQNLPRTLQAITPRLLPSLIQKEGDSIIRMEYYGYGTLAEKFIYCDLSEGFWQSVLSSLFQLVQFFKMHSGPVDEDTVCTKSIYIDKTFKRLDLLLHQRSEWHDLLQQPNFIINNKESLGLPNLQDFIQERAHQLVEDAEITIIHGDLCFSNILYDVSSGVVKLVDPRGEFGGGVNTIYGDPRYDLAKLRHSFCGNYDSIIEGDFNLLQVQQEHFKFHIYKEQQTERDRLFDHVTREFGYKPSDIQFIEALLFLSMLPLHEDSFTKQLAFFVTAIQKLNICYNKYLFNNEAELNEKHILQHIKSE